MTSAPPRKSSLARRTLVFTAARIAGSLSIILLFIVFSHLLPPETYGSFRQVWMVNKGLLDVLGLGVPLSIYYFLPKLAADRRPGFVWQSFLILGLVGCVLSGGLYVAAPAIARQFHNPAIAHLIRIFAIYPLFALPVTITESALLSLNRAVELSAFLLVDRVVVLVVGISAILLGHGLDTVFWALAALGVLELLAALGLVRWCLRDLPRGPPSWNPGEQLRFALPSGLSNLVDVLNVEVDKLITASFVAVPAFASYANGAFEVPLASVLVGAIGAVLLPEFAARYHAGERASLLELWQGAIERVAALLVPATVFLWVFAPDVVILLFSSKYEASVVIFQIYLLALLPKLAWYGPTLVTLGRNRSPLYGSLIAVGCNALLSVWLIRRIGLPGPAIATVLTAHLLMIFYLSILRRALDARWSEVFPWRRLALILGLTIPGGALVWPLRDLTSVGHVGRLTLGAAVFTAVTWVLYRRADVVRAADVERIRRYVSGLGRTAREA